MPLYTTNDGLQIVAAGPTEFLEKLRQASHAPLGSLKEFKAALVERAAAQTGCPIWACSDTRLVYELLFRGLITIEGE